MRTSGNTNVIKMHVSAWGEDGTKMRDGTSGGNFRADYKSGSVFLTFAEDKHVTSHEDRFFSDYIEI